MFKTSHLRGPLLRTWTVTWTASATRGTRPLHKRRGEAQKERMTESSLSLLQHLDGPLLFQRIFQMNSNDLKRRYKIPDLFLEAVC